MMLYAFMTKYTPAEINVYAIDYSAKMMSAFETMPHVGGVIYEGQDDTHILAVVASLEQLLAIL